MPPTAAGAGVLSRHLGFGLARRRNQRPAASGNIERRRRVLFPQGQPSVVVLDSERSSGYHNYSQYPLII